MKIIRSCHTGSKLYNDELIASEVTEKYARFIAACLNREFSVLSSPYYFMAVEDDYKLYIYDPV